MLTAEEALKLSRENYSEEKELNQILAKIEERAKDGWYNVTVMIRKHEIAKRLSKLRYSVQYSYTQGPGKGLAIEINWEHLPLDTDWNTYKIGGKTSG